MVTENLRFIQARKTLRLQRHEFAEDERRWNHVEMHVSRPDGCSTETNLLFSGDQNRDVEIRCSASSNLFKVD
tara:strand:- start:5088 stop:5306 length:219 start_codon:yes stop_codon:yes gene_type:complete